MRRWYVHIRFEGENMWRWEGMSWKIGRKKLDGKLCDRDFFVKALVAHRHFFPQKLLHTKVFSHRNYHNHRNFSTQRPLHTDGTIHKRFYTNMLLHTTSSLTHTETLTHRLFYTRTLLRTDAFTHWHSRTHTWIETISRILMWCVPVVQKTTNTKHEEMRIYIYRITGDIENIKQQ